jgi:hypothetical protein
LEDCDSINKYLEYLKQKISVFDIIFEDRPVNKETLKLLEYTYTDCKKEILNLTSAHYSEGPVADTENSGEYWVFGKQVQKIEIYIKINIGLKNKPVICISFHKALHKMNYPLKGK